MKRLVIITVLASILCSQALASAPLLILPPVQTLSIVEIKAMAVPTSADDGCSETIWLDTLVFANTTAGALTVTVADKQTSAKTIIPAVSLPANSLTVIQIWGSRMDGGFTWVASGAGVNGYFRGKVIR